MSAFLRTNHISVVKNNGTEINKILSHHLEALCSNIASIVSTLGILHNNNVDAMIIKEATKYIKSVCKRKSQKGGTSMPSDYYGYENNIYNSANENTGTITGNIDFNNGIQRPSMGPQEGGGKKVYDVSMKKKVKYILDVNNITITKDTFDNLMNIINDNLYCLLIDLHKMQPISKEKLVKLMSQKQYAVFN